MTRKALLFCCIIHALPGIFKRRLCVLFPMNGLKPMPIQSLRPLVMCAKFVLGETLSKPSNIALLFFSCFNHSILVDRSSRLCKHWVGLIRRPLMTELLVPRSCCICSVLYWACKNKHCRPVSAKLHVQTFAKISVDLNGFPNSLGCF